MTFVGADSCRAGWFSVQISDDGAWKTKVFNDVLSLWEAHWGASLILMDIPIGLLESGTGERKCDLKARKLLSPKRHSSVFRVPCRRAVHARTYEEASEINFRNTTKKLPAQTWGIVPKIREVDELLSADRSARGRIREIHPEVLFWALSGGSAMQNSKKTSDGFSERLAILQAVYPPAGDVVKHAMAKYLRKEVARDDILDALAAAVTAAKSQDLLSIPAIPEIDCHSLPMEMVYHPIPQPVTDGCNCAKSP